MPFCSRAVVTDCRNPQKADSKSIEKQTSSEQVSVSSENTRQLQNSEYNGSWHPFSRQVFLGLNRVSFALKQHFSPIVSYGRRILVFGWAQFIFAPSIIWQHEVLHRASVFIRISLASINNQTKGKYEKNKMAHGSHIIRVLAHNRHRTNIHHKRTRGLLSI